ncbi:MULTISPECIES: Gfo/Idh/MocA family protein [Brachybacterium]|uniref:Gfo/Idh/MocA family protein n=1 Tax=Brachybacterium TaxID=43668 RepID=UPI000DF1FA5F|nr:MULTISPECIES: Gfo/Idh/MocA family oxidoreductase [Brachybacterium]RCS61730.1 gfo/Idh/MocA family oxidoreductase [Brachybacterium sp. JB7]RCS69590.1 gfo/Idh/MocA family oxidoreductase [Brachybacterium alimentarium]RCS71478.1 gfo/Idh/MocA family oxidoreductase [Brachybacterium alimentarium]RCS84738.1 gfo/Idh/MocA family oxidoreductase [Brachybacterium alimentarium]
MTDLKIGVIGFGARGGLARHAHLPGEGSRVTVVAEPTSRGKDKARELFGDEVATVDDVDQLLAEHQVDAVMILAPDYAHAEVALKTLGAGIPTFSEKPMAIRVEDTDAMLALAKEKRTRLFVGHNMRHMPVIRQMKAIVDSGRIGRVRAIWCRHFVGTGGDFYFKDWHAERAKATSLLLQKGAHDIDVIHWLAGGYTRRVSGIGDLAVYGDVTDRRDNSDRLMGDWYDADIWPPTEQKELNPVIDVEDISMLNMTLDNGVLASYEQCHFTPDYWRNYTVIGDAGRIENMGDGSGEQIHIWESRRSGPGRPDAVEVIARASGGHGGADPSLVAEFLRFAREGGSTDVSIIAAREAVATGVYGAESIRHGGIPYDIPPVPADVREYFDNGQA